MDYNFLLWPEEKDKELIPDEPQEDKTLLSSVSNEPVNESSFRENSPSQNEEQMEIHHPHKVHHHKSWKGYLFEFLMLFLAVTAGFFVENRREHFIEHKRAKQFSNQLLADLRLDSALFDQRNKMIADKLRRFDQFQIMLTQNKDISDGQLLDSLLKITYVFDFPSTSTTYMQMKTSGALRYIDNPELTASLQKYYDVLLPRCIKFSETSLEYFETHVNPYYIKHFRIQDYDPFSDTLINKNPVIAGRSAATDQELLNIMGGYKSLLNIQLITLNIPAMEGIKETIVLLKNEYELD